MKRSLCILFLAALCLLTGCVRRQVTAGYDVYFQPGSQESVMALVPEQHQLPPEADPVEGLLECLLQGPSSEHYIRTIPSGVTLRHWSLSDGVLTVDFSARYATLSGVALTLADYSVVATMTQLDSVDAVVITAGGEQLAYRNHQRLTPGDLWDPSAAEPEE